MLFLLISLFVISVESQYDFRVYIVRDPKSSFDGTWKRSTDDAIISCESISTTKVQCAFTGGKYTYTIIGSKINWDGGSASGTLTSISKIKWSTGSEWIKQGDSGRDLSDCTILSTSTSVRCLNSYGPWLNGTAADNIKYHCLFDEKCVAYEYKLEPIPRDENFTPPPPPPPGFSGKCWPPPCNIPKGRGRLCSSRLIQVPDKVDPTTRCSVKGDWHPWSEWTSCTNGRRERKRDCSGATNGGSCDDKPDYAWEQCGGRCKKECDDEFPWCFKLKFEENYLQELCYAGNPCKKTCDLCDC